MSNYKHLLMLVGPAGAGKSTMARKACVDDTYVHINQDAQGRQHLDIFEKAIIEGKNVVVDRMNFTKQQRHRYLDLAKRYDYWTRIIVLHESYKTCLERCLKRENHETIKEEGAAKAALNMFFSKYERVEDEEAYVVNRVWPDGEKVPAIYSDLDGTLCDVEHRRHHVRGTGKKNWPAFFKDMVNDTVNEPVRDVLQRFGSDHKIVLCSGRPDDYKKLTEAWLAKHGIVYDDLFMRLRNDSRQDNAVKEILLDFEILTRYDVKFCLDDRDQVVQMLRKRGLKVFQVADGDF